MLSAFPDGLLPPLLTLATHRSCGAQSGFPRLAREVLAAADAGKASPDCGMVVHLVTCSFFQEFWQTSLHMFGARSWCWEGS